MRAKEQVIFDIKSDKFKYLHREENKIRNVVDIDVLNKRLNRVKKLNLYSNAKMIVFSLLTVVLFIIVSVNF
jgi:hypothetical protein|tara:strand:- start:144 stop:359 length:216 start_codon:yes stop_codon:yes gene_type:complete